MNEKNTNHSSTNRRTALTTAAALPGLTDRPASLRISNDTHAPEISAPRATVHAIASRGDEPNSNRTAAKHGSGLVMHTTRQKSQRPFMQAA